MLGPEAQARLSCEARVMGDDVHLGVVEERVLVEIRGAQGQPAVVDDCDLRVYVDRVGTWARPGAERASEDSPVLAVGVDQLGKDAAAVVGATLWGGRQNEDDPKVGSGRIEQLRSEQQGDFR